MSEPWEWTWRSTLFLHEHRDGDDWLDLGTGSGRFLALAPNGVGVDPDPDSPGGELSDVRSGSMNLVWCSEVIEHVADPLALLFEVRRVLRPGGRLLLTTPAHPLVRRVAIAAFRFDQHFDPRGGHLRFFTRRSLGETLDAAGLRVDAIRTQRATLVARALRA